MKIGGPVRGSYSVANPSNRITYGVAVLIVTIILLTMLFGCTTTTTAPDGSKIETKGPPCGFICGVKGLANWKLVLDTGFFDPMSIGFEGTRKSVGDSEDDTQDDPQQ